jgi:hypothetical protein
MSNKNLYKYQKQILCRIDELESELTPDKVQVLRNALTDMTVNQWFGWREKNAALIEDFVSRTSKQSANLKIFRADYPLLQFACLQMCKESLVLIQGLNQEVLCELDIGSRHAIGACSRIYNQIILDDFVDWPFDLPSPFEGV